MGSEVVGMVVGDVGEVVGGTGKGAGLLTSGGAGAGFTTFLPPQATKKAQQNININAYFFTIFSLIN